MRWYSVIELSGGGPIAQTVLADGRMTAERAIRLAQDHLRQTGHRTLVFRGKSDGWQRAFDNITWARLHNATKQQYLARAQAVQEYLLHEATP